MALYKTMVTKFGIDVTYHKVTTITVSWHTKECYVDVYSYVSQEIREQLKAPLSARQYDFSGDNFSFDVNTNITEQIYTKLKEMEEWTDAIDC